MIFCMFLDTFGNIDAHGKTRTVKTHEPEIAQRKISRPHAYCVINESVPIAQAYCSAMRGEARCYGLRRRVQACEWAVIGIIKAVRRNLCRNLSEMLPCSSWHRDSEIAGRHPAKTNKYITLH